MNEPNIPPGIAEMREFLSAAADEAPAETVTTSGVMHEREVLCWEIVRLSASGWSRWASYDTREQAHDALQALRSMWPAGCFRLMRVERIEEEKP